MDKRRLIEAMIPWIFSRPDYVRRGKGSGRNKYLISGLSGSGKTTYMKSLKGRKVYGDSKKYDIKGSKDWNEKLFHSDIRKGLRGKKPFAAEVIQVPYYGKKANLRIKRTSLLTSTYRANKRDGLGLRGFYRRLKNNLRWKKQLDRAR